MSDALKKILDKARAIRPLVVWWDKAQPHLCRECGGFKSHQEGCRVVRKQIALEELAFAALKDKPQFKLLPLDRQGELAVEIAAHMIHEMETIEQLVLDSLEGIVDRYLRAEMAGWKD